MTPSAPIWSTPIPSGVARFPGGTHRADIAIIGGGLTGLSTALHALDANPGARVIVVEADRIGAGASGRTTGMANPGVGQSVIALVRRLGHARAAAVYRTTVEAVRDLERLIQDERIACEWDRGGLLQVARSPAARRRLAAIAAILESFEAPVERLDDAALAARIRLAGLDRGPSPHPAALRLPVAGTLHPGQLLAGLAASVLRRGGAIFESARVTSIGEGRPVRLALDGGEVLAREVVVATGGYTSRLGLLHGRVLPLELQVLVTEPLDGNALAAIGWANREGVIDGRRIFDYFRLTADDRVVFGGGVPRYHWAGRAAPPRAESASLDDLARRIAHTFPRDVTPHIAGGWTGIIDYTVDAMPAIRRLRDRPEIVVAVGFCGHGVALSVAAGGWVARLLAGGVPSGDLPWDRDRPPLVPIEPVRWIGVRASVGAMALMDRLE